MTNNSVSLVSNLNEEKMEEVDGRTANFNGKEKRIKGSEVFQSRRERSCATMDKENNSSYINHNNNNNNTYNHNKSKPNPTDNTTSSYLNPTTSQPYTF